MRYLLPLLTGLLLSPAVIAQEEAPLPPPLPENATDAGNEELQPEISIIRRGDDIIQEYRLNGQLYMVKITPNKGQPYYLMDTDGDGSLETRRNELDNPEVIQWRIFTW